MFGNGIDTANRKVREADGQIPPTESPEPDQGRKVHRLDAPGAIQTWRRLSDHYVRELDRQNENRTEQAIDADFYDSIQWREEDAQVLKDRGQLPLVYNVIKSTIDWVTGTEKRGRSDFKILPRTKEDGKPAQKKTALLKYLSDVNRTPFHTSRAFSDAVRVGIGWLEDGIQEDDGEPQFTRFESWRNMLWDSASTEMDLSDARYTFRQKWVDEDIALALAPDRKAIIEQAVLDGERFFISDSYGDWAMDYAENERETGPFRSGDFPDRFKRRRLRIIEGWFTKPDEFWRIKGGPFNGELFDPYSQGHVEPVRNGNATVTKKTVMRMHCALFTSKGLLYLGPSPYRHNRYPFTPIWGYRRDRDGLPYGMVRGLRGMQEDINKRASKALHLLSTKRVVMEEGAVDDVDELAEEIARPDAIVVVKQGKEFRVEENGQLAAGHVELMNQSMRLIQTAGGVTDENLGRETNAKAGVAIRARQQQGSVVTTGLFDNLRLAKQIQGEKQLSLTEQFCDQPKQFRITNMRGSAEFVEVNDGLPENDIARSKADFVISEADWRATMRQAAAEELLEVMMKLPPQVALVMLDVVVENMDLPNREELVKRIRQITGQRDPDADPADMSPEEQAQEQARAEQAQFEKAVQMAGLQKLVKEIENIAAKTKDLIAGTVSKNVGSQGTAIQAAREVVMTPGVAPAADAILDEAGFSVAGMPKPAGLPAPTQPQQPPALPPPGGEQPAA